jgi:hypothetical protein
MTSFRGQVSVTDGSGRLEKSASPVPVFGSSYWLQFVISTGTKVPVPSVYETLGKTFAAKTEWFTRGTPVGSLQAVTISVVPLPFFLIFFPRTPDDKTGAVIPF